MHDSTPGHDGEHDLEHDARHDTGAHAPGAVRRWWVLPFEGVDRHGATMLQTVLVASALFQVAGLLLAQVQGIGIDRLAVGMATTNLAMLLACP